MLIPLLSVCLAIILCLGGVVSAKAQKPTAVPDGDFKINAKSALLMDYDSGKIVYSQNTQERLPIASMVKIMTLLLSFEQIEAGNLNYSDEIVASLNATSMGGSQAFLDTNSAYKAEELIKSIVVGSANDSCVAMAEHINGSVEGFVLAMNAKAKELKMENTNFINCTGLPADGQYSCAADVALMTRELLSHKDFYKFSTVWMFDFQHPGGRFTSLSNTNKLLKAYEGCDGGKTGFTNEAMFCLSATAKRGNMRLISVVCGAQTSKIRNGENAKLFNYGFANYETKQLVFKGVAIDGDYPVSMGKIKTVQAIPATDYFTFLKKSDKNELRMEKSINALCAPVQEGAKIGEIKIFDGQEQVGSVDLISSTSVAKISYLDLVDDFIANW